MTGKSKKEIIIELIDSAREFRMCGPSDDPDAQTAATVGYRHLLTQFKRLAAPVLPEEIAARLNGLNVNVDDIYTAYDARAELDAMLPDIENALVFIDEVPGFPSGTNARMVDLAVIADLKMIRSSRADTHTLVRMCEEINSSLAHGNVLATVLLMRAVLNHVPPVFGVETFEQVVANIGKSQKESFEHLQNGLRKIADFHTHRKIAVVEAYPSASQVEPYKPPFEVLLQEVGLILCDDSRLKWPVKVKPTEIPKTKQERDIGEKESFEWQVRHEVVAIQLSKINPHFTVMYPDNTTRIIYTDIFPDQALRRAIEHYIVEVNPTLTVFSPRKPSAHELRSPALRETVQKVEAALERCRKENSSLASIFEV